MNRIVTINPATGKTERSFSPHTREEIEKRLERAARAFERYRRTDWAERAKGLTEAARVLKSRSQDFARTMTLEMGKPIRSALDEIAKCAWNCRYFSEFGASFLEEREVELPGVQARIRHDPLGVVLAIMPWNFPFWQVFRFAAPALMAGNTVVLKHASNVPQCALQIEEVFREAGFAEGVFQTLLVGAAQVAPIIEDPRVAAVTLTGSVEAGSSVAQLAGKRIKKTVMELGGSDPFIVMTTVDIDEAVQAAVLARTINTGQSCIAAKRFILAELIADAFEKKFVQAMEKLRVGDPMDPGTQLGPLATEDVLLRLETQVRGSVAMGAELLLGGKRVDRPGFFYLPTVLTRIPRNAPAAREEVFGPVAALFRVKDAEHAVALANDTEFGLGASVWTHDPEEQILFAEEIQAGSVFFNQRVASDPRLPFGGVKASGYGRELGEAGIREFVNLKTVLIGAETPGRLPVGQPNENDLE